MESSHWYGGVYGGLVNWADGNESCFEVSELDVPDGKTV